MPTIDRPSADVEMTRFTPLMPATASSIGRVTSVSTSSGPAPGYGTEHVHEGEVDLGEEIDAQPSQRDDAEHHEADDDHRREDGPFDGCIRNPHWQFPELSAYRLRLG